MKIITQIKKHKEIAVLFGLPILASLVAFVAFYLPTAFKTPQHDFVYARCATERYCNLSPIFVRDGRVQVPDRYRYDGQATVEREDSRTDSDPIFDQTTDADPSEVTISEPEIALQERYTFYRYDVEGHTSVEVDFDDLTGMVVSDDDEAPDGFRLERGDRGGFNGPLLFDSYSLTDYDTYYLVNGPKQVETNLSSDYRDSFEFIGWIE